MNKISKINLKLILTVLMLMFSTAVWSGMAQDNYQFATPAQQQQFSYLTQQFRCLVCQNEALADSNAPLAQDLRGEIAQLVRQGTSTPDITKYLVQRYGDYVLFKPPVTAMTYLLWFGPFILLALGLLSLLIFIRSRKAYRHLEPEKTGPDLDEERL